MMKTEAIEKCQTCRQSIEWIPGTSEWNPAYWRHTRATNHPARPKN